MKFVLKDGKGWDGKEWDGMGWERKRKGCVHIQESIYPYLYEQGEREGGGKDCREVVILKERRYRYREEL